MKKKSWDITSPSFISRLSSYLNDSLSLIRREFSLHKLFVRVDPYGQCCCTDGFRIIMGAGAAPMLDKSISVEEKIKVLKGMLWHEVGHVLFTPFSADRIAQEAVLGGSYWPELPPTESLALREYMDKGERQRKRLLKTYNEFSNSLEDGRIENCLLMYMYSYRGFAKALVAAREYFRQRGCSGKDIIEMIKTFRSSGPEDARAAENAYRACMATVLWLAKYGTIPEIEALAEDFRFSKYVGRIAPHISAAVDSVNDAPLFYRELNWVFCESAEYIIPYLESRHDEEELLPDEEEFEKGTPAEDMLSDMGVSPMPKDTDGELEAATKKVKARAASKKAESEAKKGEEPKEEPDEGESSPAGKPDLSDLLEGSPWGAADHPGSVEHDDYDEREAKGLDLEALLSEKESEAPDDDGKADEALSEATGIDYGEINAGISWRIRRAKSVERNDALYDSYSKYIEIGKIAAKKIKPFFNPQRETFYEKDRYSGTKIVSSRLSNPDLRHFAKKTTMPKSPSLSVAILVDESGSMCGPNIEAAKAATIALYEMCRELDIPYGVFGHTCHGHEVQMTNYCYFDSKDPMDKYRLLKISAQRDNRDGAALRYVSELLDKQVSDRKLLIVISDGSPAAPGYGMSNGKPDMQQVVKDYERKGIKFIAAAIDADKDSIEDIYGAERFLDITNLELLPSKLASIVRKATQR